ncbi:MAG: SHOCT domain-containing protein [Acidobacteriota bacterium]|jgi:putative membrane protein
MMYNMGWFGGGAMWLFWILLIVVVVVLARWLMPQGGSSRPPAVDESPEGILKRRYARGELNKDDYEQRLAEIRR